MDNCILCSKPLGLENTPIFVCRCKLIMYACGHCQVKHDDLFRLISIHQQEDHTSVDLV